MRPLAILSTVALVLVAVAAPGAVLCRRKTGALFVRDACTRKESAVDPAALGLVGPKGSTGQQGMPGPPGPGARTLVVDADGTIVAQSGGMTVAPVAGFTGYYAVATGTDVSTATIQATTFGTRGDTGFRGSALVAVCGAAPTTYDCAAHLGIPNDPATIVVLTLDPSNTVPQPHPFSLSIL